MSETLDERVVKLEFDNAKFERNVKQTQKSLEKLDESLAFKDGSDGIERVEASFSHFQVVAFTIISRLTNKLIDLGVTLVKSLSIDNISAGWSKFGEKTVSVATMAAQKIKIAGKVIDDYAEKMQVINDQLEKLNWFTDETSYNFTDMVNNIGKFTAAGRSLDESVSAMMGIANWAALSGQNALTASRAMYQLSQALGKGYVQLIDWRSIQTANMDTEEFREKCLEAAVAIGELIKEGNTFITKTGKRFTLSEFTESLSSKWLTNDVLLNTLGEYSSAVEKLYEICTEQGITATQAIEKYGDELDAFGIKAFKAAQEARTFADVIASVKDAVSTGWMNTAEKIIGGYDESKEIWTELANQLYDVFAEGGNFRNEVLGLWRDLGGHKNVFGKHGDANQGAFWNIYDSIIAIRKLIHDAWNDVFNLSSFSQSTERAQDLAEKFNRLTNRIRTFTDRVRKALTENLKLRLVFQGLFNVLKMGIIVIKGIVYALSPVISMAKELLSYAVDRLAAVGLRISKIQKFTERIESIATKLYDVIEDLMEYLDPRGVLDAFFTVMSMIVKELSNYHPVEFMAQTLKELVDALKLGGGTAEDFQEIVGGLASIVVMLGKALVEVSKVLRAYIIPLLKTVVKVATQLVGFVTGLVVKILSYFGTFFKELGNLIQNGKADFYGISESIGEFTETLVKNLKKLKPLLEAIARLGVVILECITLLPNLLHKLSKTLTGRGVIENFAWIFNKLSEMFIAFRDTLEGDSFTDNGGVFAPLTALAKGLASVLKGVVSIVRPLLTIVGQGLNLLGILLQSMGDLLNGFIEVFNGEKAKTVLEYLTRSILILGGVLVALVLIYNIFYTVIATVRGITYLMANIADAIYTFANSFSLNAIAAIMKSLAYDIIAFAAALMIIANLPEEGFIRATAAIGGLIVLIAGMVAIMLALNKAAASAERTFKISKKGLSGRFNYITTVMEQVALFVMSLSTALIAFSLSVAILAKLKPSEAWAGAGILLTFMTAITVMFIALSRFAAADLDTKELNKQTKSLRKALKLIGVMATACLAISRAIVRLGSMDPGQMWMGIAGFSTILAAITAMMVAINLTAKSKLDDSDVKAISSLFMAVGALMLALSLSIVILSSIDTSNAWIGISQVIALLSAMALMCIGLSNLASKGKFDYGSAAKFFVGIGFVLLAMSGSIMILSKLDAGRSWVAISQVSTLLAAMMLMCVGLENLASDGKFDYKSASLLFMSMSAALLAMTGAIAILNNLDQDRSWASIKQVLVIIGAFTLMGVALSHFANKYFDGKMMSKMFTSMTITLLAMAGVIAIMNNMDQNKTTKSILGILAILAAFTTMSVILMKIRANGKRMKQAIIMMLAIAADLFLVALALLMLKDVPWQSMLAAAGALSMIMLAMAASIKIMEATKVNPSNIILFASSILILASSLIPFAVALKLMEGISWTTMIQSLVMMAAAMVLLIAATKILGPSTYMVLALGAAIALLGAGMLLASMSLQAFAQNLPGFLEAIISNVELISTALTTIGPVLISALIDAFKQMLDSLTDIVPSIVNLAVALINGLIDVVRETGPDLIETIVSIVDKLANSLANHSDSIVNAIGTILKASIKWLKDNITDIANDLIDILIKIIGVLTSRVPELVTELCNFLTALINSLFDNIKPVLETLTKRTFDFLSEFIPMFISELMKFTAVLVNATLVLIANVIKVTIASLGTLGKLMLDFLAGIILLSLEVSKGLTSVLYQALRTMIYNVFYVASEVLVSMVTDVPKLIGGALGKVFGGIISYVGDLINRYAGGLFGLGDLVKGWGKDISDSANTAFDQSIMNGSNVVSALNTARENISSVMTTITSNVKEDVEEGVSIINDALQDSLTAMGMVTGDNAENVGELVADGVIEGMNNSSPKVQSASNNLALAAIDGTEDTLKINSPSKVFAEIGGYMAEGLALGIDNGAGDVKSSAIAVMNDTLLAVKNAAETDIDDEIVIRPVMDLTDITSGARSISSIMSNVGNGRVSVSGELASSVHNKNSRLATESPSQNGTTVINNNETYNPVFNITSNDPDEVAREVDIRMQRMHMQANLAKGGAR